MLTKKELITVLVSSIILGFTISLIKSLALFLTSALFVLIIILINLLVKKIVAFNYETEIEAKIWEIKRWGYRSHQYFKKALAAGVIMPLIVTALSFGYTTWMAPLVFDIKPKVYRAARRHGLYKFSEVAESHIGKIAAAGILANLLFAVIGYLLNFPEFSKLSIYYALFNLIPFSDLDGSKIFFGSVVIWSALAAITLIGLLLAVFVI